MAYEWFLWILIFFGIADYYCRFKATAGSLKVLGFIENVGWFVVPTAIVVCLGYPEIIVVSVGCAAMLILLNIGIICWSMKKRLIRIKLVIQSRMSRI